MFVYVILSQVFDARLYRRVNPLPGDYLAIGNGLQVRYTNEIAPFAMCVQGGLFLTFAYLGVLLKHAQVYRTFIVVPLFHYSFVLSPLIVYMVVTYAHEIAQRSASELPRGAPNQVVA